MEIVEEIFASIGFENFEKTFFARAPYAIPSAGARFRNLRGWPLLTEIFSNDHSDCWLARNGRLANESHGQLDLASALLGFREGYSVVVRHAERASETIQAIATEFADRFGRPIDVQLYLTPAHETGFDWHFDVEDVFAIQTAGVKEFWLKESRDSKEQLSCVMKAGDVLYIPAGYWHKATAHAESFHLSIGVMPLERHET